MPDFINCPRCQRKLRLDESVIGQQVQCPSCENAFIAELPTQAVPQYRPRPDDDPPTYRPVDNPPLRPRYDAPPERRRYEEDEDYPRRRPRFYSNFDGKKPHRGTAVLTLGILSLVLFWNIPGLILAIIALVLGFSDLSAMNRGEMDDSGRTSTKAGVTCALVAMTFEGLALVSCCGLSILNNN